MQQAFLYDAIRTPFGKIGGSLSAHRPDDLAAHVVRELVARAPQLDPDRIDESIFGNANGAGEENRNVARMATLLAGLPTSIPGTTMNRLCGSSLDAAIAASRQINTGDAELVLVGGVESMSRAPWVLPKTDRPFPMANLELATPPWAGAWSTRPCPANGRSPSARPPNSCARSMKSAARTRMNSPHARTSWPRPPGTAASMTTSWSRCLRPASAAARSPWTRPSAPIRPPKPSAGCAPSSATRPPEPSPPAMPPRCPTAPPRPSSVPSASVNCWSGPAGAHRGPRLLRPGPAILRVRPG